MERSWLGSSAVFAAVKQRRLGLHWGWLAALGTTSIAASVLALVAPPATLAAIMALIAAFSVLTGVLLVVGAFKLRLRLQV